MHRKIKLFLRMLNANCQKIVISDQKKFIELTKVNLHYVIFVYLGLSPLRRSRVGMKLYFLVHALENVNI